MYMVQIQNVTPNTADNSGPIFYSKPLQKVQNNKNYNVFAIESEHSEQPESVNDTYPVEQDEHNVIIDSFDMCYDREQVDQDDDDLSNERDLLASLIEKLKCEIDDSKKRNKFLETSNKDLVDKLKGEIKDFKTKNKCLKSSNNHFKEANNELSKTNHLMFKDLKKFQAELDIYHDVNYVSKIQNVTPNTADNSRPIFYSKPLQKVQNNENYNVFAIESEHPEQPESVNDTYPVEQDEHNVIIDSLDMCYDREQVDQDDDDLSNER
nr:hypothetical protein [Tanacetum cinerariifolium]